MMISRSKCRPSNNSSRLFGLIIGDHQFVQSRTFSVFFVFAIIPSTIWSGESYLQRLTATMHTNFRDTEGLRRIRDSDAGITMAPLQLSLRI
jgi:hypothetical protein